MLGGVFSGQSTELVLLTGTGELSHAARCTAEKVYLAHALEIISSWTGYRATPISALSGTAKHLNVGEFLVKSEAERFGIGSFKALGPPYAVTRAVCELLRKQHLQPTENAVFSGGFREQLRDITVAAVTSGNHGRALAWAAQRIGCNCVIFMPAHTGKEREANISALGATVIRIDGGYDNALIAAQEESLKHQWLLIADVQLREYPDISRDTIRGYAVVGIEIARQCTDRLPSHVFVPAGSGCMAAGIAAGFALELGVKRPSLVVVEPRSADALFQSAHQRRRAAALGDLSTVMDGLAVRWPSEPAWEILETTATAILTIPDKAAIATLRALANGEYGDAPLEIGETGIAAPTGAVLAAADFNLRSRLGISPASNILAVASEGVTDRGIFSALVNDANVPVETRSTNEGQQCSHEGPVLPREPGL